MILVARYNEAQSADDSTMYIQAQCANIVITPQKLVQGYTVIMNVVTTYPHTQIVLTESPVSKYRQLQVTMYEKGTFFRKS
jgi:hypothetical protein